MGVSRLQLSSLGLFLIACGSDPVFIPEPEPKLNNAIYIIGGDDELLATDASGLLQVPQEAQEFLLHMSLECRPTNYALEEGVLREVQPGSMTIGTSVSRYTLNQSDEGWVADSDFAFSLRPRAYSHHQHAGGGLPLR